MTATRVRPALVDRDLDRLVRVAAASRAELTSLRDRATAEAAALDGIAHWLYHQWYLAIEDPPAAIDGRAHLPAALRASLPGASRWIPGWVVLQAGADGTCVAGRRGEVRVLRCGEYASLSRPGVPVVPGDGVAVTACVDWVDTTRGFWTCRSPSGEPMPPFVRLYWSATDTSIAAILGPVADSIEALGLRYSLKCPARAADFARVDSLVVYLERPAWAAAAGPISTLADRLAPHLRGARPPLTLPIARGVAFAEDPGGEESFGQSRCRALASGVLALVGCSQPVSPARGRRMLLDALRRAGVDPDCPWLAANGST